MRSNGIGVRISGRLMPPKGWRKPYRSCLVEGCAKTFLARGLCSMHWSRWARTGEVGGATPLRRLGGFWGKVTITEAGCWEWQGATNHGYGRFRHQSAHRWSWEQEHGPIPNGLTIDHLCRNTFCVNPSHLEPVTIGENLRRSPIQRSTINAAKTHCPHGHPYSAENTFHSKGRRHCLACRRIRDAQRGPRSHHARLA